MSNTADIIIIHSMAYIYFHCHIWLNSWVQNSTGLDLMPDIHLFWNPLYSTGKSLNQKVTVLYF